MKEPRVAQLKRIAACHFVGVFGAVGYYKVAKWMLWTQPNYVIEDSTHGALQLANYLLVALLGAYMTFGYAWIKSDREKDFHPLIVMMFGVGSVFAGMCAVIFIGSSLPMERSALRAFLVLLIGAAVGFPAVWVGAAVFTVKVPRRGVRDLTVAGGALVLVVAIWLVAPSKLDFPSDASFEARVTWEQDNLQPYAGPAQAFLQSLALEQHVGADREFAPARDGWMSIDADDGRWYLFIDYQFRAGDVRGLCNIDVVMEPNEAGVFVPVAKEKERSASCFVVGEKLGWTFDHAGTQRPRESKDK